MQRFLNCNIVIIVVFEICCQLIYFLRAGTCLTDCNRTTCICTSKRNLINAVHTCQCDNQVAQ